MNTHGYDCIIVGGGVGGLAAGAYLCRGGVKTILLEKNESVGGWLPFEPSIEQMMRFPGMVTPIQKLLCVGASIKGGAGINAAANTGRAVRAKDY